MPIADCVLRPLDRVHTAATWAVAWQLGLRQTKEDFLACSISWGNW